MFSSVLWSRRELLFQRLVLIYQMPKIGSQTIEATLARHALPCPVLRFHYLSASFAQTLRNGLNSSAADAAWRRNTESQLASIQEISQAMRWRRVLVRSGFKIPKLEVITGVRELVSLVLASIFENYNYFVPDIESLTVDKCREALLHPKTFKTLRNWFDLELKPFTGIDVFRSEFPQAQGHVVYENRFARVLIYRFESLHELPALLSSFLQHKITTMINSNVGDDKHYAQQYRSVKHSLHLPADFLTSLYGDKMMAHFYSAAEREQFYFKWADDSLALEKAPISAAL
jgi:hypothetical protein